MLAQITIKKLLYFKKILVKEDCNYNSSREKIFNDLFSDRFFEKKNEELSVIKQQLKQLKLEIGIIKLNGEFFILNFYETKLK